MDYVMNDEMRVARPERLAEILAVQGVPAAEWIRDSSGRRSRRAPNEPLGSAVAQMLEGERGTACICSCACRGASAAPASTRSMTLLGALPARTAAPKRTRCPTAQSGCGCYSFRRSDALGSSIAPSANAPREGVASSRSDSRSAGDRRGRDRDWAASKRSRSCRVSSAAVPRIAQKHPRVSA